MGVPGMLCSGVAIGQQLGSQGSHNSGCAADSMSFIFFYKRPVSANSIGRDIALI